MAIIAGYQVRPAARYRLARPIEDRLMLGNGARNAAGGIVPARRWRRPTHHEIEALIGAAGELDCADAWLIGLPHHLLRKWWELAELAETGNSLDRPGFDQYVRDLAEYFAYKRWPLAANSSIEVSASAPAAADDYFLPSAQWPFSTGPGQLLACINLDESDCAMIVSDMLAADRTSASEDQNSPFIPGCALLKITLAAGEGLMLPPRIYCALEPGQDFSVYLTIGKCRG